MEKTSKKSVMLLALTGLMFAGVSAAWADTGALPRATPEAASGLTLKEVVRMESQLKQMKMQAAIQTAKLHLMTINAQIASLSGKIGGNAASMGTKNPLRVLSAGCFAGKCTATVAKGNARFTVNTGEQLNGCLFVRITSGGVMVSQNGMTRWLGIDGATSTGTTGSPNAALPSAGNLK